MEPVPFREGSPILVMPPEPEPPEPDRLDPFHQTPEQKALYDALSPEFKRKFTAMMMPRGNLVSVRHPQGKIIMALYAVWVEHTGCELEEWT